MNLRIILILLISISIGNNVFACDGYVTGSDTICSVGGPVSYPITFHGTGGTGPYTFTYEINGVLQPTVVSGVGDSIQIFFPTSGPGSYTYSLVEVSDGVGCINAGVTSSATVFEAINPIVSISGTTTVIQNSTPLPVVTFTALGGVSPYTFTYSINGGPPQTVVTAVGSSTATITIPTNVIGTYTVTMESASSPFRCPCILNMPSSVVVTVVGNPCPPPTGTISLSGMCDHYVATLTASGGTGPYTYTFTINGVTQTVTGGASMIFNGPTVGVPTTFNYSGVSVTSSAGCSGTLSGSWLVGIYPYEMHNISANALTVCQNGPSPMITMTSNYTSGSPYYTLNGVVQTGASTFNGTTVVYQPTNVPGTYTYVYQGNSLNCPTFISTTVTITVKPLPTATISGTASVCKNAANPVVTFTGSGGTAPYTFTYKINGGANQTISSGAGSTATISVPTSTVGTTTYTLVSVSSSAGCSQNQTGTATITVNPLPTATISGTASICQTTSTPVTFLGAGATAPYTFTYNVNGGTSQTVTSVTSSVTIPAPANVPGTFVYNLLSVSSNNGCSQNQTGSAIIIIAPVPSGTISGSASVCQNSGTTPIVFTGSGASPQYAFFYTLNGGSTIQSISTTPSLNAVTLNFPTSPIGTTTYNLVSVQSINGCSQPQTGTLTIVVNPKPTASISGTATVCQNDAEPEVTFTGSNATAPYDFTYNINGGPNQTISSGASNSVILTAPTNVSGTFTYNLVSVSSNNGCSQNQTGSAVITVSPMPTATITGGGTLCQTTGTTSVVFTGSNGTVPYTFTYSLNGGPNQTISSGALTTAIIGVPNSIPVTSVYNLISVSSGTCSQGQTGTATVVINPMPTATSTVSGGATVCQNDSEPEVTFTGSNATAPYDFTYNINGGSNQTISSGASNSVTLTVPTNVSGTFTYNLVSISSNNGCSQNQTGSAAIIVSPMPTATITGGGTLCQTTGNTPVVFSGSNGVAPYTFTYSLNGGANQTISSGALSTATINVANSTPGTFVYDLISVSSGACSQNQSGTVSVVINATPTATISGGATICQNDTEPIITFTGADGIAPYTFTYNLNGGADQTISSGAGVDATITVPTSSSGTFIYNLLSVSGDNACSQSQTGSETVIVNATPTATLSGAGAFCQNDIEPELVFTGQGGTEPYSFEYSLNGGVSQTISTATGSTSAITIPTDVVTSFTFDLISVSDANGCGQPQSGTAVFTVNALPVVTGISDFCEGTTLQLTGDGTPATVSPWSSTNTAVATIDNNGLVTGVGSGSTTIVYTNSNGCQVSNVINVLAPLNASISSDATICAGDEVTFTISGTAGSQVTYTDGASNYTVLLPASGNIDINSGPLSNSTDFSLVDIQGQSPSACGTSLSEMITITVNPIPVVNPVSDITTCPDNLINIPAFTSNPSGAAFVWSNSNTSIGLAAGGTGNINNFTAINNQSNSISGIVSVTPTLNGCSGESVSFTITVNNLPSANAGLDQTACADNGNVYQIGSTPETGNSYQWTPSTGLNDPTVANPSLTNVALQTTEYALTVTNNFGCEDKDTVVFEELLSPVVSLQASELAVCELGMVSFDLTTAENLTIDWFIDGVGIGNANQLNLTTNFGSSGIHQVYVVATNAAGCSTTEGIAGGIQVYPSVDAGFTMLQNILNVNEFTDHLNLINQSENAINYVWFYNGNSFSTETDPTLFFDPGYGSIEILLVASNEIGCVDTAKFTIVPNSDGLIYVPNTFTPDGDGINDLFFPVVSENFDLTACRLEIYDRWGELIFESSETTPAWDGFYEGELCKTDTYVWKLRVNSATTGYAKAIEGHVNLLK